MTQSLFRKLSCFGILAVLAVLWHTAGSAQTQESQRHDWDDSPSEAILLLPPPVSAAYYSTNFTSELEANYFGAGLTVTGAYSNNIYGLSVWPNVAFAKTTARLNTVLNYSPGFTAYSQRSAPNQFNTNLSWIFQYRVSPNVTVSLNETFNDASNIFNRPNPGDTIAISGSLPPPQQAVISTVAGQRINGTDLQITYRCGDNCMIGGDGSYNSLNFASSSELLGLFDSRSASGSIFYSRRLRQKWSAGVVGLYQDIESFQTGTKNGINTNTQTQSIFAFVTYYFRPTLSISFSLGPQHASSTQNPLSAVQSWSPLTMVSVGWQGSRTSVAASYARLVSGAAGLNGAYQTNVAALATRWRATRNWSLGASASYLQYKTLTPTFVLSTTGGRTITGVASVQRAIGRHFST